MRTGVSEIEQMVDGVSRVLNYLHDRDNEKSKTRRTGERWEDPLSDHRPGVATLE